MSATPGPWRIERRLANDDENQIAIVRGVSIVGPYAFASCGEDARLVAAAPDLYAACEAVLETHGYEDEADAIETVRAALCRARGEVIA